jgi:hypothetical protein
MQDVYIYEDPQEVEDSLAELESDFPNIQTDYRALRELLRTRPFGIGDRLDPSDPDLEDVSYTDIHHTGGGRAGRSAAVLVYDAWRDINAIHVRVLAVYRGSEWRSWDRNEAKEAIRKLV